MKVIGNVVDYTYNCYSCEGFAYRPYLNENVYVISGSGTEENPYIIGM